MPNLNKPRKKHIAGAFTFISQDALANQLVDIYYEMKQLPSDSTYRLYLHLDFLDTKATKLLFRILTILDNISKRNSFPNLKIHYLYNWEDEDTEELGLILSEHLEDTIHLCQIDRNLTNKMRVA